MDSELAEYQDTLAWLYAQLPMFSRTGAAAYKPGLDTSQALDAHFGHPHRRFRSIHVGGTNGKGSVSSALAAVLRAQGFKVGLYTSPHLAEFRERIRIDGKMISRAAVTDFVRRYKDSGYKGRPSFFELTMMMAFDYFAAEKVDIAVIEVGMGGRLDSTNIITPLGCIITNISEDHTQFLGDTPEKIAVEKAGIIKHGIPVTIGEAEGAVRRVFAEKAATEGAPIRFATECMVEVKDLNHVPVADGLVADFQLKGDYQKANARTVLCAVDMLRDGGLEITPQAVKHGMENISELSGLEGRWMTLHVSPLAIADTGHNEAGLRYNLEQLQRILPPGGRLHFVLGFVADKAVDKILHLFSSAASYYLTRADIPRAMDVETLAGKVAAAGLGFSTFETVSEAYAAALSEALPDDIVYVGGSTFVVADLLVAIRK